MFIKTHNQTLREQRDAANILYENSSGGIIISLIASFGLVFGFPNDNIDLYKTIWLAVMSCVLLLRAVDWMIWKKHLAKTDFDPVTVTRRFVAGSMLTALVWSTFSSLFYAMSIIELASAVIILAAMAGGAITVLSANRILSIFYSFTLLVPASTVLAFSEHEFQQVLGYLGLMFSIVMVFSATKASEFTSVAIKINNQNADLLEQMEIEKLAVQEANSNLEEKVKRRTDKIYELSNIDPLTGLFNRSAFLTDLDVFFAEVMKTKSTLALLFIDLDGFKQINDTLGHSVGDKILRLTAERIASSVGNKQRICRWGGDEFLVALPQHEARDAEQFAKALITCLSEPFHFDYNQLAVSATVGIAMYPNHSDDAEEIIRLADTAMFVQKKAQKSSVRMFSRDMKEALRREQALKDGLALAVGNKQFHMNYQPIINATTDEIVAYEALIRWRFQDEFVGPAEFIPIAEQYGIINKVGGWVLETACQDIAKFLPDSDCGVSINVSVIQLMQANFLNVLKVALKESGIAPTRVHLEITESVFAEDLTLLKFQVEQIQALGVSVSIDDFGTGFSSLSHLQNLGVNTVKIDRSFVRNFEKGGQAIIQATLHIAKQLGCEVVAEGVETEEQYQWLQTLGVKYLQGYFFAKPMSLEELANNRQARNQQPA